MYGRLPGVALTLAVSVAACNDVEQRDPLAPKKIGFETILSATTDKQSYEPGDPIVFTIRNVSDSSDSIAFYYHCGPNLIVTIQTKSQGTWTTFWGTIGSDVYQPIGAPLVPGASRVESGVLRWPEGIYRVVVPWSRKFGLSQQAQESAYSNTFVIRRSGPPAVPKRTRHADLPSS